MNDLYYTQLENKEPHRISDVGGQYVLSALSDTLVMPMPFKVIKGTFDVSGLSVGSTTSIEDEEGNPVSFVTGNQLLLLSGVFTENFVTDVIGEGILQIGLKASEGAIGQALDTTLQIKTPPSNTQLLFASVTSNGQTITNTFSFAYSPSLNVLVSPKRVRYSTDYGVTWMPTNIVSDIYLGSVWSPYGGLFVLVGDGSGGIPRVVISSNGINFNTPFTFPLLGSFFSITVTPTRFIMLDSTSPIVYWGNLMGTTFSSTPVVIPALSWSCIDYSSTQDMVVAVAYQAGTNIIWSNDRGVTFNTASVNPVTTALLNYVKYIDELDIWVVTGDGGIIATSPDGDVWTSASSVPNLIESPEGIAYMSGLLVVNIYEGKFWVSSDSGDTWTEQTTIPASPLGIDTFGMIALPNDTLLVEYLAGTTAILNFDNALIEGVNTQVGDGFSIASGTALVGADKYLCVEVGTLSTSTEATSGAGQVVIMVV